MPDATGEMPAAMALMMAGFTLTLPFLGLLTSLYGTNSKNWTLLGFVLAILMAVFHVGHMFELFTGAGVAQFIIMPFNALTAILLVADLAKKKKEL